MKYITTSKTLTQGMPERNTRVTTVFTVKTKSSN